MNAPPQPPHEDDDDNDDVFIDESDIIHEVSMDNEDLPDAEDEDSEPEHLGINFHLIMFFVLFKCLTFANVLIEILTLFSVFVYSV